MRKFYLLTLLAFLPLLANADAVEIDGIYYNLNDQVHRAEVTVNPNGYFGEVSIASFISYDGSLYNVTSIGNLAFANCTTLTNVTIPLIVTSIGENAFKDCVGLTYVNIPCNVSSIGSCAFSGCNQLTDVYCNVGSVPNTETDAFSNVPINQVTLHVPAGSVDAYKAASPWSGFKEVKAIETKKTIDVETAGTLSTLIPVGEKYLIEELTLTGNLNGDDLALLRDMAGNNKNGQATPGILTTLDMSGANIVAGGTYAQFTEGVVQIRLRWKNGPQEINGSYWIMDSPEGADAHISTANTIGAFLFAGCGSLETVKLPNTLISLEDRAFSFTQLKSIIIPTPVESIEPGAFSDDPLITSIAVDPENAKYESPNNNCIIEKSSHTLIVGCNDMVIPADKGLISIGNNAFEGRMFLTRMDIPEGITTIGNAVFRECRLISVTLPSTLESLGSWALGWNYNTTDVYCKAKTVPTTDVSAFEGSNMENVTLHVPAGSVDAYKAASPWSGFKEVKAIETKKTINVETAGTLPTLIPEAEKYLVEELTLTGNLNGDDLALLRDMAGSDYNGFPTDGKLSFLDMSGATIVAGGKYVELVDENIYYNREIGNFHGGFDKDPQVSEANTLGKNVFAGCSKLETMIMPTGVVTVGERAFSDTSLKDIVWPTSLATIGYEAFFGCKFTSFTLPASVEGIGGNIVESCGSLIELSVESGNTRYDSRDNCNALIEKSTNTLILGCKNSTIPNSVTAIGDFAFSGCSGLTSLFIPSSVTAIGKNAFWRCSGLTSISIGSGVTSIGSGAFASCSNVTTIVVEDGNTAYDSRNNCNAIIEKSTNTLIAGCNNSTIPDGVTVIGDGAFQGCTGITSLVIPNSVTAIGECAFDNCTGLTSVTFSDKLISIGNWSFYGIGVTSLTIPNSVTTIGEQAFYQCRNLTSATIGSGIKKIGWLAFGCLNGNFTDLYCYAEAVPKADETMGSSYMAFDWSINKAILHVPAGSVDAYKATEPWSGFKEVVAIATEKAVNVTTAGTLSTLIADGEKNYIENLTITGNLNGADLRYLREMAGSDYNGVPTDGKLSYLDMSGATIIAGENYVELLDGIIIYDKEIGNYHGGFDKDPQVSEANTLGKYVFAGCSKLETIKLPASVLTIGERAFSDTNLKDIVLPRSLTTIGNEAFFDCKFTSFTLPASVESVGGNILKYCSTLELSVESGNSNYDSRDNCNAIIETSTNTLIGGCKNTIIPNSVTSIGVEAFCGCASGLLSLTIPSSVTSIGYDAFEACSDLVHVYCNAEVVPTTDADAFKNVDIRNRVTLHVPAGSVEAYQAAAPWSGFNKVVALSTNIPDVEIQGVYYNLNEETLTAEVTKNPDGSYSGDLLVGSGIWYDSRLYSVTSIGNDAFAFSNLLTSVVIPNSVTSIGSYAFYFCEDLSSIMIPNSVTKIFGNPFQGCSSLESILVEEGNTTYDSHNNCNAIIETGSNTLISGCKNTVIPANVTTIGDNAFTEIANLTSITIPVSVEYIGSASFSSCSNLESIQVESGNTKYDSRNNCNAIIETASNTLIHGCKNTVIPANVTSIGEMAFDECDGLTSVTIPSAVTFIGISAFEECKDLVSMQVESGNTVYDSRNNCNAIIETASNTLISGCKNTIIPISVTSIGENAFRYCFGLISVTIPCDVTSIGNMAFFNCYQLTDIYCSAENVPTTGYGAFDAINGDNVTLYVPAGSVEAYKTESPWKDFGTIRSMVTSLFDGTNLWTSYVAQKDYAIPAGLEAYVISNLSETSAVASQIDYIPQGVPLLLKRNDATTNSFDFATGSGTAPTTNLLKVYDTDKTVSNREGYILYKDEFVLVDEGTLPAGKVFLPLNGGNSANTRGIVIEGEGTTGIQNLVSDSEVSHGVWYDLQGRKIDGKPIKKGVYILNGRKVVVK